MKPLVKRIFEFLEQEARRLFDPESELLIPAKAPTKVSDKPRNSENESVS